MRMSSPSQKQNSNEMRARLSNEVIILPVHTEDEQFPCSHLQSTLVSECTWTTANIQQVFLYKKKNFQSVL